MRTALGEDPEQKQLSVGLPLRLSLPLSPIRACGRYLALCPAPGDDGRPGWHPTHRQAGGRAGRQIGRDRRFRSERLDDKARSKAGSNGSAKDVDEAKAGSAEVRLACYCTCHGHGHGHGRGQGVGACH